jgi:hypothetical protein
MSVDNYLTRKYIPEDNSELHTRRRENLKSHIKHSLVWQLYEEESAADSEQFGRESRPYAGKITTPF